MCGDIRLSGAALGTVPCSGRCWPPRELPGWGAVGRATMPGTASPWPGIRTSLGNYCVRSLADRFWWAALTGTSHGAGLRQTREQSALVAVVRLSVGCGIKLCHCPKLPFPCSLRESSLRVLALSCGFAFPRITCVGARPAADPDPASARSTKGGSVGV